MRWKAGTLDEPVTRRSVCRRTAGGNDPPGHRGCPGSFRRFPGYPYHPEDDRARHRPPDRGEPHLPRRADPEPVTLPVHLDR